MNFFIKKLFQYFLRSLSLFWSTPPPRSPPLHTRCHAENLLLHLTQNTWSSTGKSSLKNRWNLLPVHQRLVFAWCNTPVIHHLTEISVNLNPFLNNSSYLSSWDRQSTMSESLTSEMEKLDVQGKQSNTCWKAVGPLYFFISSWQRTTIWQWVNF